MTLKQGNQSENLYKFPILYIKDCDLIILLTVSVVDVNKCSHDF